MRPIARFAWGLLAYDVAVVAWGAYVRATGAGAGCGRHWPTCNGDVIPRAPRLETLVELSHRVSSALAFVLTLVLLAWAMHDYPRGHRVRRGAALSAGLMVAEGLIGAGLVLFALVAHDASLKRALSISVHLVNTFFLLAATSLTAFWASGAPASTLRGQRGVVVVLALPLVAMLVVGASGAVTALGDTLFPSATLSAGIAADFARGAPAFVRLRAIHPLLAAATAATVLLATGVVRNLRPARPVENLARITGILALLQLGAGLANMAMRAPVAMQLVHVALADALWIALVLTTAAALSKAPWPPASSVA